MIYSAGTVDASAGGYTVTGTGTRWLKRVHAGDVFQLSSGGTLYLVAAVVSDTSLHLAGRVGATISGASYTITSDFSRYYSIPYPRDQDIEKASVLKRSVKRVDKLLDNLHDRVLRIEYPAGIPLPLTVTPSIGTVYIAPPPGGVSVSNATVTPGIGAVVVTTPGIVTVSDMESTPSITSVILPGATALITADSVAVKASSDTYTADGGSTIPQGPGGNVILTADAVLVTADSVMGTADGLYTA